MTIEDTLFLNSVSKTNQIFSISENLEGTDANGDMYVERLPYLTDLLGESGYISFHPNIQKDLREEFVEEITDEYAKVHSNHYHKLHRSREEEEQAKEKQSVAYALKEYLSTDNLLANRIPNAMIDYLKRKKVKGYNSPKVSKNIAKVFGEHSNILKWYTNKCPKKLEKGEDKNYRVTLSILPHHIAGMSYFSSYNFGGGRWITGYEGTTCMDTERNGNGENIYSLPPNLLDSTLAIAYLSTSEDEDIFNPIYQARLLVRAVKVNENDYILLGLRPFFTSHETEYTLIEGLKSMFPNFVHVSELRKYSHNLSYSGFKEYVSGVKAEWNTHYKEECSSCEGSGVDYYEETCSTCGGCGWVDETNYFNPYVDDPDFFEIDEGKILFKIPKAWLEEKGYIEKEVLPSSAKTKFLYLAC